MSKWLTVLLCAAMASACAAHERAALKTDLAAKASKEQAGLPDEAWDKWLKVYMNARTLYRQAATTVQYQQAMDALVAVYEESPAGEARAIVKDELCLKALAIPDRAVIEHYGCADEPLARMVKEEQR